MVCTPAMSRTRAYRKETKNCICISFNNIRVSFNRNEPCPLLYLPTTSTNFCSHAFWMLLLYYCCWCCWSECISFFLRMKAKKWFLNLTNEKQQNETRKTAKRPSFVYVCASARAKPDQIVSRTISVAASCFILETLPPACWWWHSTGLRNGFFHHFV